MIPKAKPAIILTGWRTGGTFLTHCLSNHSEVFCVRGEPMHHENVWRHTAKPGTVLECIFGQPHYLVGCCKLCYSQAFGKRVWPYLVKKQPRVIWLYRQNVVRQAVSFLLAKQYKERPKHVMTLKTKPAQVEIAPSVVIAHAQKMVRYNKWAKGRIKSFKRVLRLSYAQVVGSEQANVSHLDAQAKNAISEFLGISNQQMFGALRRTNPYPLREMLTNWPDVKKAIKNSEFAEWLKDEW